MKRLAASVALTALSSAAACDPTGSGAPVMRARLPVVYGDASPPGTIDDSVLLLRTTIDGRELLCSSSLVAGNLALTARHCTAHSIQGPFNCTVRGELIDNPDGAGQIGLDLPAESLEFYAGSLPRSAPVARGTQIFSAHSDTICLNDLALVVLDRTVDLPILPMRLDGRARVGEDVTLVGYGLDERQLPSIDYRTQQRRRRAGLRIAGVGPDTLEQGVTTVAPRTILIEGPAGCVGDSGGPLMDSATHAVLGVYSLLDGVDCIDSNARHDFVHVPPFRTMVDEAFRAAGANPLSESKPPPDAASDAEARADGGRADAGPSAIPTPASSDEGCAIASARARGSEMPGALCDLLAAATCFRFAGRRRSRRR